ncbi:MULTISPECIES: AAA family ATPase [unclassified Rhizobium]|uniref:ParA family protein n=1 Tax=unclassified Rhizobium TaxID=2613769 RepID=UPI0016224F3B|nr:MULTISPECIES: AAA family ATPase [unclassified Rhizobium]MBB3382057.1 cellulose biosynthesis protein BcsQ [Rhizobium sp. BK098]MBB3613759.1 cellulose biosynthesis protein BcsQ [Rhizobium sp. BK609]MBB3679417.1 cellulose biosynthesis protein BcsQ [Rhizobium sp. BK612]
MKQIAIFNHKGGVSKTTTTFHLSWMLAELGVRVMVVDCDPQCNLTGVFLGGFEGEDYPFESTDPQKPRNIRDAVRPAFESRPYQISGVEAYQAPTQENLFLLPGHVGLSEYESQLAVAHELSNTLSALQNIPGALRFAIQKTAKAYQIDLVLIDMSPSLGAINQNLFMTSDAFIIPMAPDLFSSMALKSLARVLPKWAEWGKKAASNSILRAADYPFPMVHPMYLGSTVQNFRKRARGDEEAKPTQAFQLWFDKLKATKESELIGALDQSQMLLDPKIYKSAGANPHEFLMEIANFDSLIAIAQEIAKPVFAIDLHKDTPYRGNVAETYQEKIEDIRTRFKDGAEKVIKLTSSF